MTHQTTPPLAGEIGLIQERHDADDNAVFEKSWTSTHIACHSDRATLLAALDKAQERIAGLEGALLNLANAADAVGCKYFDTDDLCPEVLAMQDATLAGRNALPSPGTKGEVG